MGQGSQGGQAGHDLDRKLSRAEASHAVTGLGWRLVLGDLRTEVLTGSLPLAADVAARAAALPHAEGHLRMDIREDRVVLMLQTAPVGGSPRATWSWRNDLGRGGGIPADHAGGRWDR